MVHHLCSGHRFLARVRTVLFLPPDQHLRTLLDVFQCFSLLHAFPNHFRSRRAKEGCGLHLQVRDLFVQLERLECGV